MPGWKLLSSEKKDSAYSWLVAGGLFLVNCIDDGILKAFGVLLNSLSFQYNVDVWIVGTTVSVMSFFGNGIAMMASPLVKLMQPRHLLMICGCASGLGFVLASFTRSWTIFSIEIIILSGIGMRCSVLCIFSYLQIYFDKHYALAGGVLFAGRPIGTVIFAPLTQAWLYQYGVRGTLLLLGAITFHIALVGALLKPQGNSNQPVENESDKTTKTKWPRGIRRILELFEVHLFRKPAFLSIFLTFFASVFGFQAWLIYLIPHALEKGLTPYQGTTLAIIGGVGQLIGLVITGVIVDAGILAETKVRLLALIFTGISFGVDRWCDSFVSLLLLSFIFGVGVAAINPATLAGIKNLTKSDNIAAALGYLAIASAISRLISGTASGWFYDQTGSYDVSFLIVAGVQFSAVLIHGIMVCTCKDVS